MESNDNLKLEEDMKKLYSKIKESFGKYKLNQSYKEIKILFDDENKSVLQLFDSISTYVRLTIEEKTKYQSQTSYEVVNIDDIMGELYRKSGFSQAHFKTLIDTLKRSLSIRNEDISYIENLKSQIIDLEREKALIIENCSKKFSEFKTNIYELINKVDFLEKEKSLLEDKTYELSEKLNKCELQDFENKQLRMEIDKIKLNFNKEKTKIIVGKNLEINQVNKEIKKLQMIEKEKNDLEVKTYRLRNQVKEETIEKKRVATVREQYITFYNYYITSFFLITILQYY